jgi:hypothetical protein
MTLSNYECTMLMRLQRTCELWHCLGDAAQRAPGINGILSAEYGAWRIGLSGLHYHAHRIILPEDLHQRTLCTPAQVAKWWRTLLNGPNTERGLRRKHAALLACRADLCKILHKYAHPYVDDEPATTVAGPPRLRLGARNARL